MSLILEIADKNTTHRLQLTAKDQLIGRSSRAAIQLIDPIISGQHMSVRIDPNGRVIIKDLGSTNGTYINGNLIQETYIYVDDIIHIGQVKITLLQNEMSPKEKKLHTRDFQKTNITFIGLHENRGAGQTREKVQKAIEAARNKRRQAQASK